MPELSILHFKIGWDYKGKKGDYHVWHEPFIGQMRDWTRVWYRLITEILIPFVVRQFRAEGREGEGERKWAELAPTTLKRRLYPGKPILQQTGMLQMSFIGGPEHDEEIKPQYMRWGSASPIALYHQTGTGIKYLDRSPRGYQLKVSQRASKKAAFGGGGEHWEPTEKGRGMPQRPILDFYWLEKTKTSGRAGAFNTWMAGMERIVQQELILAARRAGYASGLVEPGMAAPGAEALRIGNILMGNV